MSKQISAATSDEIATVPGVAGAPCLHCDEPADEYLISALADKEVWAMNLLYQRYSGLLFSVAYRIVADLRAAEDLLQEVFLAAWQHAPSYDQQSGSVTAWLTSIMRHRAIDHLRRMHRHHTSKEVSWEAGEQDSRMGTPDIWDEAWRSLQGALVRECLMRLQPEQRAVIELAYFEGRTQREIASTYKIPLGTVKARMRLGLQHLRRELEKRGMSGL